MMTNLFISFDPSTNLLFMNWFTSLIWLTFIPCMYWNMLTQINLLWLMIISYLYKEFFTLLNKNMDKEKLIIFMSLFIMIMLNNFLSLFPYIFPNTSHLIMNLTLALPLWISFMLFSWIFNIKNMLMHLIPMKTPLILMPFMISIELISNLIQPWTLMIRLTANLTSGHLMMILLSNMKFYISLYMLLFLIQMLLITLEISISIIQAYVFSMLTLLYSKKMYYGM